LFDKRGYRVDEHIPRLGRTVGDELLEPTRIYVPEVMELFGRLEVKSMAFITSDKYPGWEGDLLIGSLKFAYIAHLKIEGDENYYLTSTAEIPVTNMLRDQIIDSKELPIKWVSHTPCFRSEAGSYGKDTKGLMRVHQFEKVELVQVVEGGNSEAVLEELTSHAEAVMQALEIPYRVVSLCTGELGFSAAKTYDIEAWIPSQANYREISSCSNFKDFQSRRMHARWKNIDKNTNELVHTLNGSGLAVGRTLLAIIELNQLEDGSIKVPEALRNYFSKDKISLTESE